MTRMIFFTASTLDGFIATEDHSLDWLLSRDIDHEGPGGGAAFMSRIGAAAMGASTYQWILDYAGVDKWEYEFPCWVFTHRDGMPVAQGPDGPGDIRFTQDDVRTVYDEMAAAAGDRDLWMIGGGDLAGQFADAGLLDEMIVSFAPVTIGAGKPLLPRHVELELTDLARNGEFAIATYRVKPPAAPER